MFSGEDGVALRQELDAYLKRPEHRTLLEEQQKTDLQSSLSLKEHAQEMALASKLSSLDLSEQKKLRSILQHGVLRRLLISMSNTSTDSFHSWIRNPRVMHMFTKAHRLLRKGAIQEAEMEHVLRQHLDSIQPQRQRGHGISLSTADLLTPMNEHLEERQRGNAAYGRREFETASRHYERALAILKLLHGRHVHDVAAIQQCRNELLLNTAAVSMAQQLYGAVIETCSMVLQHDPDNLTALQRRARALHLRHEPEAARRDWQSVMRLKQRRPQRR